MGQHKLDMCSTFIKIEYSWVCIFNILTSCYNSSTGREIRCFSNSSIQMVLFSMYTLCLLKNFLFNVFYITPSPYKHMSL